MQHHILEQLAKTPNLNDCLHPILNHIRGRLEALRLGQADPQTLLISQTLSRPIEEYKILSPAARAAIQLQTANKPRFPGQQIRFIYTIGQPGVFAWDYPKPLNRSQIDVERYIELTLRAVTAVLQPWGIKKEWLEEWVLHDWHQTCFYLAHG